MEQQHITFLSRGWLPSQHYKVALVTETSTKGIMSQRVHRLIVRFPKTIHVQWKWHEIRGISWNYEVTIKKPPHSSVEPNGTFRLFDIHHVFLVFSRTFHGIPWNLMELFVRQIKYHRVPWNCMEFWGNHSKCYKGSIEFHGICNGIPWNSGTANSNVSKFHWIPLEIGIFF